MNEMASFINLLGLFSTNDVADFRYKYYNDALYTYVVIEDAADGVSEWWFDGETGKFYLMYVYKQDFETFLANRGISYP